MRGGCGLPRNGRQSMHDPWTFRTAARPCKIQNLRRNSANRRSRPGCRSFSSNNLITSVVMWLLRLKMTGCLQSSAMSSAFLHRPPTRINPSSASKRGTSCNSRLLAAKGRPEESTVCSAGKSFICARRSNCLSAVSRCAASSGAGAVPFCR